MDDLNGRVALVTGASRGIGRAIALALARRGADVAVNARRELEKAEDVAGAIRALGRRSIVVGADVSVAEDVRRAVATVEAGLGAIDVLVNNAGIARPLAIEQISLRDWEQTLAVNLTSIFLVTQAVLPGMRARRWGRVINISSTAAQLGGVVGPHYAASKAGILGLTHGYAARLASEGITVNAIAPALVATDMIGDNPRVRAEMIPVGRFGTSEEVGEVAAMLAVNGYITGQTINVNGGLYMS
ncbi:MAG TPA: 3-oxoacyl-ACP reductase family protein [Candidatus Binatia bacterium]|nr:3-oxoacyl-ACP reductase family protein [Candidatus Binatia bacterium]